MKTLLLAAGFGSRLRPLTDHLPKCLIPIHGKPLLHFWMELLSDSEINDILINLHYLPEKVRDYIDNEIFKDRVTLVYENELLGTGGTLLNNQAFFKDESILLIHADNLSRFNIGSFIKCHNERPIGTLMTMMTFCTDSPRSCGIVELDDNGIVIKFHEKVVNPPGNLANGAVYILEPEIIDFLRKLNRKVIDFSTEVLPFYLGRINTFHNNIYHRDIGNIESYYKALQEFPTIGE